MGTIRKSPMQDSDALERRIRLIREICFVFFSGLCTIADAMTTALGVSSSLAFETNPMVAWRVANPPLFIAFEAGWFFITVAYFQILNYVSRNYDVCKPFLWWGYTVIVVICIIRLLSGLNNVDVISSALKEVT
ncbi:MAG: DUF5658 family protein [Thermoproteota archaeon]